jgi:hypothetical protein
MRRVAVFPAAPSRAKGSSSVPHLSGIGYCLLPALLLANAGCADHDALRCFVQTHSCGWSEDPHIGELDLGRECFCPWDMVTDEVVIVREALPGCVEPCSCEIQSSLENRGIRTRTILPNAVLLASRDLFASRMSGTSGAPLIIIACGCAIDDAVRLCRSLNSMHVDVDRLILVGNNCCVRVPANVRYCANLYYSRDALGLWCGKVVGAEGNCTEVINHDLSESNDKPGLSGTSPWARELAVKHALGIP